MAQTLKFGNGNFATKAGSTLCYDDQNGNFKPIPMDFSRNSIGTRVNKQGLIEVMQADIPRIDYTDTDKGVALLEPQRTNIALESNQFNESEWSKTNTSVSANETGVGGSTDAWLLSKSSSDGLIRQFITTTGANTFSVYVKKGSLSYVRLFIASSTESSSIYVNLNNGSTGTSTGSPTVKVVTMDNSWYRCIITKDTTNINNFRIYPANADNDTSGTTGNIYIQNAQVEVGSYETSYIPTSGSTVQRAADVANNAGNSEVFSDSSGVLFANISALTSSQVSTIMISLSNGSSSAIRFGYQQGTNLFFVESIGTANSIGIYSEPINSLMYSKISLSYKENDVKLYINGFLVATDTVFTPFTSNILNNFNFDNGSGASDFYGKTKELSYYCLLYTSDAADE